MKKTLIALAALAVSSFADAPADGKIFTITNPQSGKCLDIDGAKTYDGANLQQWDCNPTLAQQFKLHHIGADVYAIRNVNSGRLLDLAWGGADENIHQWDIDISSPNRQFEIVETAAGSDQYTIEAMGATGCLDVQGGSVDNGANIWRYACDATPGANLAQVFEFNEQPLPTLPAFPVGLKNVHSGLMLDLEGNNKVPTTNVQQWGDNGSTAQDWVFQLETPTTNIYKLRNVGAPNYLDVAFGGADDNVQIWQEEPFAPANRSQLWSVYEVNGNFILKNVLDESECLEVEWAQQHWGANVKVGTCNGGGAQQWELTF